MMKKIFTIQIYKNQIVLFNLNGIDGLKKGDVTNFK